MFYFFVDNGVRTSWRFCLLFSIIHCCPDTYVRKNEDTWLFIWCFSMTPFSANINVVFFFPSFLSFFLLAFLFLLLPLSLPPTVFYLFLLMHCVRIKDAFAFTPLVKVVTMHTSPTDYYPSPMSFKCIYTSSFTRSSTIHVRSNHKNTF